MLTIIGKYDLLVLCPRNSQFDHYKNVPAHDKNEQNERRSRIPMSVNSA